MPDFVLVQGTANNPPGTSLVPMSAITQSVTVLNLTLGLGVNNNLDLGDATFVRLTPNAGGSSITGVANGFMGRRILFRNLAVPAVGISFNVSDVNSLPQNRIISPTGAAVNIGTAESIELFYDATSLIWLIININT